MKVILLQDIKTLGKKGDIKDVSEGYARNFLIPRKLAQIATDAALKSVAAEKEKEKKAQLESLEKLKQLAQTLKEKEFVIKSKGKGGKLFGSITAKDIAAQIRKASDLLNEKMVELPSPIKKSGEYKITIKLSENISTEIKIKVEEE